MQAKGTNHYLYFSKRERRGIIFILFLTALIYVTPNVYSHFFRKEFLKNDVLYTIENIKAKKTEVVETGRTETSISKATLFYFDPNSISIEDWVKLGVREKTALGIRKYISKGGKFKRPDDLKKIWGINPEKAEELIPYVKINLPNEVEKFVKNKNNFQKQFSQIDINIADSATFETLPGIGPKLSQRIVNFRERLGGFYKIEQIAETFGLPDSTFQKIKPRLIIKEAPLKKININTATLEELKAHPYIRYQIANAIINFKKQHGDFSSTEDLKKILLISDEIFEKVKYYLTI